MLDPSAVDAFLFDLDGTLMDTDDQAVGVLASRLARLWFRDPHRAARRLVMSLETPVNVLMTVLDLLGLDAPATGLAGRVRRWRGLPVEADFRLVAGVHRALHLLSSRYRLAVVTTRGRKDAGMFLDRFALSPLFEVVVTRESTWRLKPHPRPILHAAEALGVPVTRCVMVGDTTVDVKAARRAGAWAVAVLCGFGEREELERAGAHMILPSPSDVPAALGREGSQRLADDHPSLDG
jgi:phosphoglycolate phosphatase-like HAD superfamily hydrolase